MRHASIITISALVWDSDPETIEKIVLEDFRRNTMRKFGEEAKIVKTIALRDFFVLEDGTAEPIVRVHVLVETPE